MSSTTQLDIDITANPNDEVITIPNEETTTSDEQSQDVGEETTTSDPQTPKKNKSNFKKLASANKKKDKQIAELEAKLAEGWGDIEFEDDSIDDNDSDELSYDRVDLLEFLTDTPWAWELKNEMKEALDEFPWISFDKALAYAKAQIPQESRSHTMFNAKSSVTPTKKKLTELTSEEAGKSNLTPRQYDTWANAQKPEVNPFGN